jgi:hypothetical protein
MWTDFSEECITSTFRVENQLSKKPAAGGYFATQVTKNISKKTMYHAIQIVYIGESIDAGSQTPDFETDRLVPSQGQHKPKSR